MNLRLKFYSVFFFLFKCFGFTLFFDFMSLLFIKQKNARPKTSLLRKLLSFSLFVLVTNLIINLLYSNNSSQNFSCIVT